MNEMGRSCLFGLFKSETWDSITAPACSLGSFLERLIAQRLSYFEMMFAFVGVLPLAPIGICS